MNDFDRFTEFLSREGASYHAPPETPADAMWPEVEARLMDADDTPADPLHALAYHEPPPAPRDEMWERIEAEWVAARRIAPAAARVESGSDQGGRLARRWTRQGNATAWAACLAAAASLVIGLALGRGTRPEDAGSMTVPLPIAVPLPPQEQIVPAAAPEPEAAETLHAPDPGSRVVAAESATGVEVPPEGIETEAPLGVVQSPVAEEPVVEPNAFEFGEDYVATRHLDRAATLLTAFRIDQGTPTSQQDLARWARELLGDTRMHLDLPVSRPPLERALLEDLELVLLQISRLGPGAPDFEWQLARESMEWKGTLMRLRAASAIGET